MDIDTYIDLTGNEVDDEERAKITAQIKRTRIILESLLGYSLDKKKASENQYEEKGKTTVDCIFTSLNPDLNNIALSDPDEVIGSYRLYPYNRSDQFLAVDPYKTLHKVKLVFIQSGEEPNGLTHKTYTNAQMRVHKTRGVSKYIEHCKDCRCTCRCDNCVQVAVDADWLNETCVPEELLMVWADMVAYYSNEKTNIKSETLGTHSYTKDTLDKPEELDQNLAIIKRYAGPNGAANKLIAI